MKRVVIAFSFFILLAGLTENLTAQMNTHRPVRPSKVQSSNSVSSSTVSAHPGGISVATTSPMSFPATKRASPLTIKTNAVSYFQDTTGDNWWIYAPVFSAGPDSMNYLSAGEKLYLVIQDSIGPQTINIGGGQTETHDDTMYTRVMGLRVSVPTNILKAPRLDSAAITLFPLSISPKDVIEFWAVPIDDAQFGDANGTPTNIYPIPDLFANTPPNKGTYIAKGSIPASALTVGQLNTVTVNFGHKSLGSNTQFGICVFVDGPDFRTDTIGYQMDANLQPLQIEVEIDTDGSQGMYAGVNGPVEMRTYHGNLDAGHLILDGKTSPVFLGGMSGFFVNFEQLDPLTAQPTLQSFFGNLVMTTYMSGTDLGVDWQQTGMNQLQQNYPNPVMGKTSISFELGSNGSASIKLFNGLGNQVGSLVDGEMGAGPHSVDFNAAGLPDGAYFYTLRSGDQSITRMMSVQH